MKRCLICVFLCFVSGCVSFTERLSTNIEVEDGYAYVYSVLEKEGWPQFGLIFDKTNSNNEYILKFLPNSELSVVKIQPGEYELIGFVAADAHGKEHSRVPINEFPFSKGITVEMGNAYYLGYFKAKYSYDNRYMTWSLEKYENKYSEATELLYSQYSNLSKLPTFNAFVDY